MTQSDLFELVHPTGDDLFGKVRKIRRARKSDPESSKIAADEIGETAESQCARILAEVVKHPGCTTQELAAISGWSVHTLGRRLPELRTKGRVFNPWFGAGIDAMQLRRCAIRNRLALCWCPSVLP